MKRIILAVGLLTPFLVAAGNVSYTSTPIQIDGVSEDAWDKATWHDMPYLMDGALPDSDGDFKGRYRLLWDENYLYLQASISDDVLIDTHANPTKKYWNDDALEVFIDSDASGGNHQFNHTAFAYHIGLDNQAADFGPDRKPHLYTEHLTSRWQRQTSPPYNIIWEVAIKLFPNNYQESADNAPLVLHKHQIVGFMLAYCDNDGSELREHFMGSHEIQAVNGDKNRGYIDADVFAKITLLPKE
ncbi:CBM9 family sugar-binding protein [Alteromonas sp. BMJM2]|uniref:CBM9 family sugar-binding protein n=1 Tax=Alteromonas sp. BMJM2 TaxID=2954241 RepID=UPI0022B48E8D|nr:CBM9 family sugar-binding protein [Alteromonas sp. BMJM2]